MKSHIKIYLLVCIAALLLTGCDTVFDVHPYDVRIKSETNLNAKNIQKIEQTVKSKDTIRFAVISDSHQWYDDLQKAVNDINSRQDSIDFVIHCGDISDFGATREMKWTRERMLKLKMPSVVLLGNHDCLGTGNQTYEAIYGDPDFSFIAGKVKFVCLNTNAIEYDYSRPVPNFDFMEAERSADSLDFDRTVVCMHAPPYSEQFNNNVAKVFNYYIHEFPRLLFCLDGHGHHTKTEDLYNNGTLSIWQAAYTSVNITFSPSHQRIIMLKSSIFKFSIWALLLLSASTTASAVEEGLGKESSEEDSLTRYDRRILRYRKHWDVLMPTQSVIQTCGNMGIISLGIGWDYGKRSQWETHLLFGIVPKYDSDEVKMTITLKENFIPWRKDWGKGWQFEPLECTLYLNTVLGHDFWTKQPTKYESGYYPFSTRIRPNLGFGERFTYQIPNNRRKRVKSLTFFYELSTNDIYFMRFYRNGNAGFWDVFGLSFGAKMQIL